MLNIQGTFIAYLNKVFFRNELTGFILPCFFNEILYVDMLEVKQLYFIKKNIKFMPFSFLEKMSWEILF